MSRHYDTDFIINIKSLLSTISYKRLLVLLLHRRVIFIIVIVDIITVIDVIASAWDVPQRAEL